MATPFPSRGFLPEGNPISQWVDPRRNTILGLGAGLLSNDWGDIGKGAMQGAQLDQQYAQLQADQAQQEQETNATRAWLEQSYPEYSMLPPGEGFKLAMAAEQAKRGGGAGTSLPSNVQEWQYYSTLSPEDQSRYLTMKRSNPALNIGTGFVTQDMANPGNVLGGPIAIENQQAAYDTGYGSVTGKTAAENDDLARSVTSKMPGLRSVVDTLTKLADTATYTQSGQIMDNVKRELGLPVGQGAIDRASYIAIVDNQVLPLLKDTFGAAFTVQEGESLRATLGDPNKSPAEKKAILEAFIEQKERDVAAMTGQAALQGGAPAPAPQGGGFTILGVE
jgi:hypothetical protein